ncbi:MAG: hypothetical protein ACI3Z7_02060 [Candidatus Aphodosoma sp.]
MKKIIFSLCIACLSIAARAGCSDHKAAPIVTSVPIRIFEFTYCFP